MDKKQLITVSVLGALIVALVCFVVVYSGNSERLTSEQIMRIDDKIYEIADVERYMRVASIESGDKADKVFSEDEKASFFEFVYLPRKAYATAADGKKILFPDEELTKAKSDFVAKSGDFAKYGITEEEYLKYAEDGYKEENLTYDFTSYYKFSEEEYEEFTADYSGDDLKTYTYRLMKFTYEEPESGESGDVLDEHDHEHEEEEVDRSKETVFAKAQTAWNAVKSGDDFETVAKEYADGDYTFNDNSLKFVNGEVLTQVVPVIKSQMSFSSGGLFVPTEVLEKMKTCGVGEYTEIIEVPETSGYYFVKIENVEDGFVGEADEDFRKQLLSSLGQEYKQYWDNMVYNELDMEVNQAAITRFIYR